MAPLDTLSELQAEADEVVCLQVPSPFGAIGAFYEDFRQLDDDDVRLLDEAAKEHAARPAASQP
ncbi:hypothetical protein [Azospirillum sp. sgz302134]